VNLRVSTQTGTAIRKCTLRMLYIGAINLPITNAQRWCRFTMRCIRMYLTLCNYEARISCNVSWLSNI